MAANIHACDGLLNLGHVAADAFAAGAACLVMRVLLDCRRARPVGRIWTVTFEAQHVGGVQQLGVVCGSVYIVATGASDAVGIHHAIREVIALHSMIMTGPIGKMGGSRLTHPVPLEVP